MNNSIRSSYIKHMENRRKILSLLRKEKVISNSIIAKCLGVSRERARQYARRLVREGYLIPTRVRGVYLVNKKLVEEESYDVG